MPRKPSLEIKLRCNKCKEYTQTTNPIILKKKLEIDFTSKLCVQFVINIKINI